MIKQEKAVPLAFFRDQIFYSLTGLICLQRSEKGSQDRISGWFIYVENTLLLVY